MANTPASPVSGCRKMSHREVERQRRHEMATLCVSLRSLLPHEYLKGKRSISDQVTQASSYIAHKQKKIRELIEVRDDLRRGCECKHSVLPDISCGMVEKLEVRELGEGVEVVMGGLSREGGRRCMSCLVGAMEESIGLDVVSCSSSSRGDQWFHVVQSTRKVSGGTEVDIREIKRKLVQALQRPL
ncbi:transcription factor bHLH36 [Amborella trichopoda]|uniref:BHLH domain-containing protein n=1 Tax=Amborella trichopoda TaxID=13333 RepID=U5CN97_AMBTC|nr:transcription factor bHLH36 [Amborella trichopoda]ERN14606.1 hypothetical protein AMTR_s00038p00167360 [Amborella trichopoda]|eukprot:XP_006853139.1 transcription factor bHLH36 [Amborella trichopoda]